MKFYFKTDTHPDAEAIIYISTASKNRIANNLNCAKVEVIADLDVETAAKHFDEIIIIKRQADNR